MHLGDEINGTKWTKQLQNNEAIIEHKTACLAQLTNRGRRCHSNRKILSPPPPHPPHLAKVINN